MAAPLATDMFSELVVAAFGRDAGNSNDRWSELVVAAFGRAVDWQQKYFQNWGQRHLAAPLATSIFSKLVAATFRRAAGEGRSSEWVVVVIGRAADNSDGIFQH